MKKNLFILGPLILVLIAFALWFLIGRDKNIPAGEAVKDLLPFGSDEGAGQGTINNEQSTMEEDYSELFNEKGAPVAQLFPITSEPIAGAVAINKGSQTAVRYVERGTGHVVEVILPSSSTSTGLTKNKITNNTLPRVYEAHFRPDGSAVILRMLDGDSETQRNIILNFATSSTGVNLRGDISSLAVAPGNSIYYVFRDSKVIATSNWSGSPIKTLYSSAFSDWIITPSGSVALIFTKPSYQYAGYAYLLNPASGSISREVGPLNGLSAISDSGGDWIYYSYNDGVVRTAGKNIRTDAVVATSPATLIDKCVSSSKTSGVIFCGVPVDGVEAGEPDNWYQGKSTYFDRLWTFDLNQEIAQVLSEPKVEFSLDLDVVDPKLSPSEDYLIFTNKRDGSLWAFNLN